MLPIQLGESPSSRFPRLPRDDGSILRKSRLEWRSSLFVGSAEYEAKLDTGLTISYAPFAERITLVDYPVP